MMRTAAWIVATVVCIVGIAFITKTVVLRDAETQIGREIASGKRPFAPQLPAAHLSGVKHSPIPGWGKAGAAQWSRGTGEQRSAPVTVVNYWASWCGPCKKEARIFGRLAREFNNDGVLFVGVNGEDVESDAREFIDHYDIRYPIVRAKVGEKAIWAVQGFPETFIVGTDGRISTHFAGPIEEVDLRNAIDDELDRA